MQTREEEASLLNIGNGVAVEKFDHEWQKVLHNILDPNTPAEATRKIVLTVTIKPDDEREMGSVFIDCKSQLPGDKPVVAKVAIGRAGGHAEAHEFLSRQTSLFDNDKVSNIDEHRKEK